MEIILSFLVGTAASVVATLLFMARQRARFRMRFRSLMGLIDALSRDIRKDNYEFARVVTIGRNSGVVGSILAGHFGLDAVVSVSTRKTRRPDGTRSIEMDEASLRAISALGGQRVLLLICCNDSGSTLQYVYDKIRQTDPPPEEVRTAALYTAPSPTMVPRYRAVVIGKDSGRSMSKVLTGLPWVSEGWRHPFVGER